MAHSESKKPPFIPVRPPGPPKVWFVVDGVKKNEEEKPIKFIIQEIPEDRYEDVLDHMCTHFIRDEPLCKSHNGNGDPVFVENFRTIWLELIKQGISVAAFVENPNGGKPIIAGVNMLGVDFRDQVHDVDDFQMTSKNARTVLQVVMGISEEAKIYERYDVDRYMFAFGLSVDPAYRGQALGAHILRARENIGREYKIPVTSTAFTSPISQKLADRCGFEVLIEREYSQMKDDQGDIAFPNVDVKIFKLMARRLY